MEFSHGPNIQGQHVDCWVEKRVSQGETWIVFIRRATREEIKKYCKEGK